MNESEKYLKTDSAENETIDSTGNEFLIENENDDQLRLLKFLVVVEVDLIARMINLTRLSN